MQTVVNRMLLRDQNDVIFFKNHTLAGCDILVSVDITALKTHFY